MNQSCPQCNNDGGFCNFCGNKSFGKVDSIISFTRELSKEEMIALYKLPSPPPELLNQDPYEAQCQWENCSGGRFCEKHSLEIDPYLAQGSNLRVHHPVQPKTQVEKWREEIKENQLSVEKHCPNSKEDGICYNCITRENKIIELEQLIADHHKKNSRYLNRYQTGTFADDEVSICCGAEKSTIYPRDCPRCGGLFIPKKHDQRVTLLDKIKKLLQ